MAALFQEGCKQQPGHSSDMMRDFAKQFVWTTAMMKSCPHWQASQRTAILELLLHLSAIEITETSPHVAFRRAAVPTARRAPL